MAEALAEAAKGFVVAMKVPKAVRVVWPDMISERAAEKQECREDEVRVFAWDCLTGDARALLKPDSWNAKGCRVDLAEHKKAISKFWQPSQDPRKYWPGKGPNISGLQISD